MNNYYTLTDIRDSEYLRNKIHKSYNKDKNKKNKYKMCIIL